MTADTLKKYSIDLQLFAEKTEKPTQKRRDDAAKKGQIAQSPEINSVLVLLAAFVAIKLVMPYLIQQWGGLVSELFKLFSKSNFELDNHTLQSIYMMTIVNTTKIVAPIVGGAMLAGLLASYIQTGFKLNVTGIKFDLNNINPISGIQRMFSVSALMDLVKSVAKLFIIGYIVYSEYAKDFPNFVKLSDMNIQASSMFIGQATMNIVYKVILWLGILAVADFIFQKWNHERQLKMSKDEIKEEYKQQEGDPKIKGKIRQKRREMAMARMMQALPKADVVITNPTHFAVALQYDSKTMSAPIVLAKGQDRVALRIKEIAREHNIVIVENKPLAQSLFRATEIGDSIPAELFQAVAEVLAFVYKLKKKI